MKSEKLDPHREVFFGREGWDVPIRARSQAYLRFSRQIDRGLDKLVERWVSNAAPNAAGHSQRRTTFA